MASSGYVAWSVIAGETPTTAKWNLLGSNDASFNAGLGFNDSVIVPRHLSSSLFSTGITTYTNTGSAGGTFYYANIGGIKMFWGTTATLTLSSTASTIYNVTLPSGFFTTLQSVTASPTGGGDVSTVYWGISSNATSTTTLSFYFYYSGAVSISGGTPCSIIAIGT